MSVRTNGIAPLMPFCTAPSVSPRRTETLLTTSAVKADLTESINVADMIVVSWRGFNYNATGLFYRCDGRAAIFTFGFYDSKTRCIPFRDIYIRRDAEGARLHSHLTSISDLKTIP